MNAAPQTRQEAHDAHKARRLRMEMPAFGRLPAPEPVLPLARVDPKEIRLVIEQKERREARNVRRSARRLERRENAKASRHERSAVLLEHVAAHYGVTVADLRGRSYIRKITVARHAAIALLADVLGFKMGQAAGAVGRGHHTTAMAAVRSVRCRAAADAVFAAEIAALERELRVKLEEKRC